MSQRQCELGKVQKTIFHDPIAQTETFHNCMNILALFLIETMMPGEANVMFL